MSKAVRVENLTSSDFEQRIREPKALLFDLETSPGIVATWGAYEQNALWVIRYPMVITFSVKYLNGRQITKSLADYDHDPSNPNDLYLVKELYDYLDSADFVIAQNGDSFDLKVANTRFLRHKMPPLPKILSVDTKKVAKRNFRLFSNKLDWMGDFLELGHKTEHEGIGLWRKCVEQNDAKAWSRMKKYCAQDVKLLEKVYLETRGWDQYHPNMNVILNRSIEACPNCMSKNTRKRGFRATRTGKRQEYGCNECGRRFTGKHQQVTPYR